MDLNIAHTVWKLQFSEPTNSTESNYSEVTNHIHYVHERTQNSKYRLEK